MIAPHADDPPHTDAEVPDTPDGEAPKDEPRRARGQTRACILEAAIHEFARFGFGGASTLKIAKRARTKQPLLHYHFGSKQKLWQAAVDIAFTELTVTFDTIIDTAGDLREVDVLKLMLRTLNRFASRHPLHVDIMQQELAANSERTQYLLDRYLNPMYRHMNVVIDAAAASGQIKRIPAQFLSSMMFGAITHYFSSGPALSSVYGTDVGDPEQTKAHGDWLVEVMFNGLTEGDS